MSSIAQNVAAALESAIRAPSSHNTQPWIFQTHGERVRLYADRTRALAVNDPHDRELTISCGCALFNLVVSARAAGRKAEVRLLPDEDDPDLLAAVDLADSRKPDPDAELLATAIDARRTCRSAFTDSPVPDSLVGALIESAALEGAELVVLDEDERRARVLELIAEGDRMQFADARWRRELAAWMHPRRRGDGLTVPVAALPVTKLVVTAFDLGGRIASKDVELARGAPLLAALTTSGDGPREWLVAGQAMERVLLRAASEGVQASYLNQPCQLETLRPRLQQALGRHASPQIIMRLGIPTESVSSSPRRRLDEVVEPTASL